MAAPTTPSRSAWRPPSSPSETLRDGHVIDAIAPLGRRLMTGIASHLTDAGIPAVVSGLPQIFNVSFGLKQPPLNYRDLMLVDRLRYVRSLRRDAEGGAYARWNVAHSSSPRRMTKQLSTRPSP